MDIQFWRCRSRSVDDWGGAIRCGRRRGHVLSAVYETHEHRREVDGWLRSWHWAEAREDA